MPEREIETSTTDTIPGDNRSVTRSAVGWYYGCDSPNEAYEKLLKWARDNNFDAIVGLRFTSVPDVAMGNAGHGYASVGTNFKWTAYGTCISYQR